MHVLPDNFSGGLRTPIFKFPISNFAFPGTEKGVNQNHVFPRASRSKQTIGARNKCQFFAVVFFPLVTAETAGLPFGFAQGKKNPALRLNLKSLRRQNFG
jgi:hypothetical protein